MYAPGEAITGILEVECDQGFDSKETTVTFAGTIKAEASYTTFKGNKSTTHTAKLDNQLLEGSIEIAGEQHYEKGIHHFPFSFGLPTSEQTFTQNMNIKTGMLPSLEGSPSIKYLLSAQINVSRLKTLKAEIPITIFVPLEEWPKVVKNKKSLEGKVFLETDSDIHCIGTPFELRYKIKEGTKVKKMKLEFLHEKYVRLSGINSYSTTSLYKTEIPTPEETPTWQTITLELGPRIPQSFNCEVIESKLLLKVNAELGRISKVKTELNLLAYHCPDKPKPHEEDEITTKDGTSVSFDF